MFLYQMPEDGGGEEEHHDEGPPPEEHHDEGPPPEEHHDEGPPAEEHHDEGPPPEEHHEEEHHEPPAEEHGHGGDDFQMATPDPTGALSGSEHIAPDPSGGGDESGAIYDPAAVDTRWETTGPPADATAAEQTKWDTESAASMTGGGEYGAMGGEYGAMGGGYGAYGGEYGSFDPQVPPPVGELTDAPAGVQDIFAMAEAGDITYEEAYEKAEEDFDWQSDAQEDIGGEYGEYGATGGEYGEMTTPDPTGELAGAGEPDEMDDDEEDEDEDGDWDDEEDGDEEEEEEDDDEDETMSPGGRM